MGRTIRSRGIHVVGADERRSPEELRRVARAIIALARAQLETEAQAEHIERTSEDPAPAEPSAARRRKSA